MKSFQFKSLLLLTTLIISLPSFGQGLKAFKLKNGLSVYIWEDESKSDVFGLVLRSWRPPGTTISPRLSGRRR